MKRLEKWIYWGVMIILVWGCLYTVGQAVSSGGSMEYKINLINKKYDELYMRYEQLQRQSTDLQNEVDVLEVKIMKVPEHKHEFWSGKVVR